MPKYTSTRVNSLDGTTVNNILDTDANIQTITVTLRSGQVATATQPIDANFSTAAAQSLTNQFREQNVRFSPFSVQRNISATASDVRREANTAAAEATATNTTVPAESEAIPVSNTTNPNPVPPSAAESAAIATSTAPPSNISQAWQNRATNTKEAIESADASLTDINRELAANERNRDLLFARSRDLSLSPDERAEANILYEQSEIDLTKTFNRKIALEQNINDLNDTLKYQNEQAEKASSDPNTLTVPPPVTEPGGTDSTDYIPPVNTPPIPDEFAGYDLAQREAALREQTAQGITAPPVPNDPYYEVEATGPNVIPQTQNNILPTNTNSGLTAQRAESRGGAKSQDLANFISQKDWRVRLRLSPSANYLYKSKTPGILQPLSDTDGVIFPYTPNIQLNYASNYEPTELIHSNYKVFQYKNSNVDNIQITCDFTAQDTFEANYLLAVIHFFRSATKMFYGQDNGPKPGTPPPLCFLIGLGEFQFNDHPLAITSFTYNLPNDVDYIRAGIVTGEGGSIVRPVNTYDVSATRLNGIKPGGNSLDPEFGGLTPFKTNVTYVPTKMQISISCIPMLSRNSVSNDFSLNDYASGKLLRGIQNVRGGFW